MIKYKIDDKMTSVLRSHRYKGGGSGGGGGGDEKVQNQIFNSYPSMTSVNTEDVPKMDQHDVNSPMLHTKKSRKERETGEPSRMW